MRGLALIGTAEIEVIVCADWYVDLFFPITVHVTEHEIPCAVGKLLPALIRGRNTLTFRIGQELKEGQSEQYGVEHTHCSKASRFDGLRYHQTQRTTDHHIILRQMQLL